MLTLTGCTLTGNQAGGDGGALSAEWGTTSLTGSTFSDDTAANTGGGLSNWGALRMTDSTFSGNSAGNDGGGLESFGDTTAITHCTLPATAPTMPAAAWPALVP